MIARFSIDIAEPEFALGVEVALRGLDETPMET
jgi:hypothetical protein